MDRGVISMSLFPSVKCKKARSIHSSKTGLSMPRGTAHRLHAEHCRGVEKGLQVAMLRERKIQPHEGQMPWRCLHGHGEQQNQTALVAQLQDFTLPLPICVVCSVAAQRPVQAMKSASLPSSCARQLGYCSGRGTKKSFFLLSPRQSECFCSAARRTKGDSAGPSRLSWQLH